MISMKALAQVKVSHWLLLPLSVVLKAMIIVSTCVIILWSGKCNCHCISFGMIVLFSYLRIKYYLMDIFLNKSYFQLYCELTALPKDFNKR